MSKRSCPDNAPRRNPGTAVAWCAAISVGLRYDGIYLVKFRIAEGDALAISIPRSEAAVIRHFQAKNSFGLVVPDVKAG
jgi:hypothetical protein